MTDYEIHKAAGVMLRGRKQLVVRSKNRKHFVEPGGKLDPGETSEQALVRELNEELSITVNESDLEFFGTYYAIAAGSSRKKLRMDVYMVDAWRGEPKPSREIRELAWISSAIPTGMQVGSILEHDVIPHLLAQNLID